MILGDAINDLYNGHGNGYPGCCVAFFSFIFHPLSERFPKLKAFYAERILWSLPGNWAPYNIQYIPCPLCLLRRSFKKTENPFSTARPIDATREDYEEMMGDVFGDFFLDEEPF